MYCRRLYILIVARYETSELIDLNESAIGYGASCGPGSNATWACMPTGNLASGVCHTGGTADSGCNPGIFGAIVTGQ